MAFGRRKLDRQSVPSKLKVCPGNLYEDADLLTETQIRRVYAKVIKELVGYLILANAPPAVIASVQIHGVASVKRIRWHDADPATWTKIVEALGMAEAFEIVLGIE